MNTNLSNIPLSLSLHRYPTNVFQPTGVDAATYRFAVHNMISNATPVLYVPPMSRTVLLHARRSMAIVERTTVCYAGYATIKRMDLSHTSACLVVGDREITPTLTLLIISINGQSSFCRRMAGTNVISNDRNRCFIFYEHACTLVGVSLEYLVWYCFFVLLVVERQSPRASVLFWLLQMSDCILLLSYPFYMIDQEVVYTC